MSVRVTQNLLFRTVTNDIQRNYNRIFKSQSQVATAKRVNRPSDDPVTVGSILEARKTLRSLDQFDRNIEQARRFLASSDSVIGDALNLLSRAKQLAIQAANTPVNDPGRDGIAIEIEQIQMELVKIANTQQNGQQLFGGSHTKVTTFSIKTLSENLTNTENTRFKVVVYNGQGIDISDANDIDTDSLSTGSVDETPESTLSVSGGNIANAVFHPVSGLPVATFGAGTVQNQARSLSKFFEGINIQVTFGDSGKIQINETGKIFTGDGSNDDGDSEVNVFRTIDDLRIAMVNNSLTPGGVTSRITELDYAMEQLREAQARVGSRMNRVEQASSAHESIRQAVRETLSNQEDLDIAAAITELQLAQTVFQAALASAGRILPLSLLNFLS